MDLCKLFIGINNLAYSPVSFECALFGSPVAHSLSPIIHRLFAQQCGLDVQYSVHDVADDDLFRSIQAFMLNGGCGVNITAPYKESICKQLTNFYPNALAAGAVNTLVVAADKNLWGANTDGGGLVRDLWRLGIKITGKELLICGAGGAARGVLPSLLKLQPKTIYIVNRDLVKAQLLKEKLSALANIKILSYREVASVRPQIIINATSLDLGQDLDTASELFKTINFQDAFCYDVNYKEKNSAFMRIANSAGAKGVANGLGMLVEQAAIAFYLWHRVRPDTQTVLMQLRESVL